MENLKKNPLSLQLNVEDFAPASNDEKKSLFFFALISF